MNALRVAEQDTDRLLEDSLFREAGLEDEPRWLEKLREEAWEQARDSDLPSRRAEFWRFTELRALRLQEFGPTPPPTEAPSELPAEFEQYLEENELEEAESRRLNLINYRPVGELPREEDLRVYSFQDAVGEIPELLQEHLYREHSRHPDTVFTLSQKALLNQGVVIHIPEGAEVDQPLEITNWTDASEQMISTIFLVIAEDDSEATIYLDSAGPEDLDSNLILPSYQIYSGDRSHISVVHKQSLNQSQWIFGNKHVSPGENAWLRVAEVTVGGRLTRTDMNAVVGEEEADLELLGLSFASGNQQFNHYSVQNHRVGNAFSDLLYKTAAAGRSRAVFYGNIAVEKNCDETNAYLSNHNLLLSERATINTMPTLEIMSDDVKCSHGATVGELDEQMRFYLLSRGIPEQQANKLLVLGFFGEVLTELEDDFLRNKVESTVQKNVEKMY